jgi:hypothetical protein
MQRKKDMLDESNRRSITKQRGAYNAQDDKKFTPMDSKEVNMGGLSESTDEVYNEQQAYRNNFIDNTP